MANTRLLRNSPHTSAHLPSPVGAVIVAAGQSYRMAGVDKVFVPVAGRPLILHTLQAFLQCSAIAEVALVVPGFELSRAAVLVEELRKIKPIHLCEGGPRRQDSVKAGLDCLGECRWIAVHDGARPCVGEELILRGLEAAQETGAAAAAVPAVDTIKLADDQAFVLQTLPRERLWVVQTPQVFRRDIVQRAHREVREDVTDDAAMTEKLGIPVKLYAGSYDNIKVTTPVDLALVEAILRGRPRERR